MADGTVVDDTVVDDTVADETVASNGANPNGAAPEDTAPGNGPVSSPVRAEHPATTSSSQPSDVIVPGDPSLN